MKITVGSKIKFKDKVKSGLKDSTFYEGEEWNLVDYMIVLSIDEEPDDKRYTVDPYNIDNILLEKISGHCPRQEDCIPYYDYNINEIMSNLDKLKNKWKR